MNLTTIGASSLGLPIQAFHFEGRNDLNPVLILGGVHGDEVEGVVAAQSLLSSFSTRYPYSFSTYLVPMFNPDGVLNKTRMNGNGVDLNRNLPTRDWSPVVSTPRYHPGRAPGSEPENQALMILLNRIQPRFILSLHSWKPLLNINGNCLPFAKALSERTGYVIEESIGYPTPGCLGTYAGLEREWPTLTYEIERGLQFSEILSLHVPAILESLKVFESPHQGK